MWVRKTRLWACYGVLISNVVCSNSASRISSIIGGIPEHLRTAVIPGTPGTSR